MHAPIVKLAASLLALGAVVAVAAAPSTHRQLLVLNKDDATMVGVDVASGKVTWTVPVGEAPHELAATPDGKYAFASNYGTGPAPGHTIR